MMIKQINNEKILLLVVLHMVNHQSEATLICKTFSLACIRSLQPLPPILDQPPPPSSEDLDQLVWFDADDGEVSQDDDDEEDDEEDQRDDYTAIEGLENHQDISELVWMDAGTDGEDKDDFHVHRVTVSESSWQTDGRSSSNSLMLEALLPENNMDGKPSTFGPATASSAEALNTSTTVDGVFLAASTDSGSTVAASIAASGNALSHPSDASSRRQSSLTTLG
jgi:hypothetical protein